MKDAQVFTRQQQLFRVECAWRARILVGGEPRRERELGVTERRVLPPLPKKRRPEA